MPTASFCLSGKELTYFDTNYVFNENRKIYAEEKYKIIAEYFLAQLNSIADHQDRIVKTKVYTLTDKKELKNNILFVDNENNFIFDIKEKFKIKTKSEEGFWILITNEYFIVGLTGKSANYVKDTLKEIILMSNIAINGNYLSLLIPGLKLVDYPDFNFRGLHLTLFDTLSVDKIKKVIDAVCINRFNYIFLTINNGMIYHSHPEISKPNALTIEEIKEIITYAKEKNIEIIPEINLLSHQEWLLSPIYPDLIIKDRYFSNSQSMFHTYIPKDERIYKIVFELLDEIIEIFQPKYIHIGHDEAFGLRVFNEPESYQLFAEHVNRIRDFLARKGIKTLIWGDMLRKDHNGLEKSIYKALDLINKDIIICNWYYKNYDFSSIDYFTNKGFNVIAATFKDERTVEKLTTYLKLKKNEKVLGAMATTWYYLPWGKMEMLNRLIEFSGKNFW